MLSPLRFHYDTPNFNLFTHDFDKLLASDTKIDLSLGKMVQAARENRAIYSHISEPFLPPLETPEHSAFLNFALQPEVAITSFTVAIASLLFSAYLFWRLRTLAIVVTTLQGSTGTHAFPTFPPLHTLFPRLPTPTYPSPIILSTHTASHTTNDTLNTNMLIISLLVAFIWYVARKIKA